MGLTYIVGARKTGKTTRLLVEYKKDQKQPFIVPNFALMHREQYREIRQNHIHNARYLNMDKLRGIMRVYCDDFNLFPYIVQETLISWHIDIIATMTPDIIDMKKEIPPYWKVFDKAHVINTGENIDTSQYPVISTERIITDFKGYFIIKP